MEITSLPTESLYKFMALSGLVIIFATAAYAYRFITSIGQKMIELETEIEITTLKSKKQQQDASRDVENYKRKTVDFISPALESMRSQVNAFKEGIPPLPGEDEPRKAAAERLLGEVNDSWRSMASDALDVDILFAGLEGKAKLLEYESKQKDILKIGCVISLVIGLCLAYYGFSHWLIIQGYIDQGVIREALKK
jgi:hypothetical protein